VREAVLLSVTCAGDVPFFDVATPAATSRETFFGDARVLSQVSACALWPVGPVARAMLEPVATDVPILAFVGERDPVTPPAWAQRATAHRDRGGVPA
jgi:hypothetical protein